MSTTPTKEKMGGLIGQHSNQGSSKGRLLALIHSFCTHRAPVEEPCSGSVLARLIRLPRLRTADLPRPREARLKGYNPGGSETDREEQKGSAALGRCLLGSAFLLRLAKGKRARRLLLWA